MHQALSVQTHCYLLMLPTLISNMQGHATYTLATYTHANHTRVGGVCTDHTPPTTQLTCMHILTTHTPTTQLTWMHILVGGSSTWLLLHTKKI